MEVRDPLSCSADGPDFELIAHIFRPACLHGDLTDSTPVRVRVHMAPQRGLCIERDDQHVFGIGREAWVSLDALLDQAGFLHVTKIGPLLHRGGFAVNARLGILP